MIDRRSVRSRNGQQGQNESENAAHDTIGT